MKYSKSKVADDTARILDSFEDGFLQADIEGRIVFGNRAIAQMCRYGSVEEMIGLQMENMYAIPGERGHLINEILDSGKLINRKIELVRKDGSTFPALCNIKYIYDQKGNKLGTEGAIKDITELIKTQESLSRKNQELNAVNQQLAASEQERQQHAHNLAERIKELQCFYEISESIRNKETIEEIMQDVADIIPPSWQYPEITCGRVRFEENEYVSQSFEETQWLQSADIVIKGELKGSVEVFYLEERPELCEGPFLKEERKLIDGIAKNISEAIERKKAEDALRKSEEKFRILFEYAPTMLGHISEEGAYIDVNNSVSDITGHSKEFLTGGNAFSFIHKDDQTGVLEKFSETKEKGSGDVTYRFLHSNGTYRTMVSRAIKIHETNTYFVCSEDITDRLKAETELRKSEENLRALNQQLVASEQQLGASNQQLASSEQQLKASNQQLEASEQQLKASISELEEKIKETEFWSELVHEASVGIAIGYPDGRLGSSNKAFQKLTGYSEEELKSINWNKVLTPPEWADIELQKLKELHETKNAVVYEKEYIKKNGERLPIELTVNERLDEKGDVAYYYAFVKDITYKKEAEQLLVKSEKRFRSLFENSPFGIVMCELVRDKDDTVIDFIHLQGNNSTETQTGFKLKDLINKKASELVDKNTLTDLIRKYERVVDKSTSISFIEYYEIYNKTLEVTVFHLVNDLFIINFIDISARIKSEKTLFESEAFNRGIVDNSFDCIKIVDLEGNIQFMSKGGRDRLEIKNIEDYYGKSWINLFKGNDRKSAISALEDAKSGKVGRFKSYLPSEKGKPLWWDAIVTSIANEKGKPESLLAISRDITKQITAEEKLRESEEMLRNIFDNSTSVIYSHDINNVINYVSPRIEEVLGYTQEEIKINWTKLLSDNPINELAYQYTKEAVETGKQQQPYELELLHKNGKKVLVEAREAPVVRDGKTVSIVGIFNDITERKYIENELKLQTERLQLATESANIGIWEWDLINNVLVWDKQMFNLYGINPDDFGGAYEAWKEGVHPDDISKTDAEVHEAIAANRDFHSQFRVIWPNGQIHFIEAHAMILSDVNGQPASMIGVNWEITERIKTENDLIKAKEKAEESDRLKSAFLSNMSHEIRTPMNGILGFTDLLNDQDLSGEQQNKFIEIIRKSGERMLNTVNDIIDVSKIDAGQMELTKTEVNIFEEIENQFEFFEKEATAKGLELKLINKLPQQSIIISDMVKLNSIITNLIKNAIKYTDKGSIEIECDKKDFELVIQVSDTGIGIPENRIQSIFNRFEQAEIDDVRQGSGLGLTIVKSYAEMLDGHITVRSVQAKGTTFIVRLPWIENKKKPVSGMNEDLISIKNTLHRLNILIAEDEDFSFEHFKIILSKHTKKLFRAINGKEALGYIKNNADVDLVLMDIKMPDMDGYQATKEIRKFNKDVIIIAQTAFALQGDKEKALAAGCDDYITKPIKKEELLNLIKKHLTV